MDTSSGSRSRSAAHAGSWYSDVPEVLGAALDGFLAKGAEKSARRHRHGDRAAAVIAPHAGYAYSGPTAGVSFAAFADFVEETAAADGGDGGDASAIRVFVLGPSHHVRLSTCALSPATTIETPVGDLAVDTETVAALGAHRKLFSAIDIATDEEEHSLEMQYPMIAAAARECASRLLVVPIMVGDLSAKTERRVAAVLEPYFGAPQTFFVISSDFCHWGAHFGYQPVAGGSRRPIHKQIKDLDRRGMDAIASQSPSAFRDYLSDTRNTICGRRPIGILLSILELRSAEFRVKWMHYEQSAAVESARDSSVSYAAAHVFPGAESGSGSGSGSAGGPAAPASSSSAASGDASTS